MDHSEFAALLRTRREAVGLSLRRLATSAEVNQGTLSHAEAGDQRRRLSEEAAARVDAALAAQGEILRAWRRLPAQTPRWPQQLTPNQLPADPVLIGRAQLLEDLYRTVNQTGGESRPTVVLLTGPGGVGKTAMAVRAAHQLSNGDGALMADLRGWHETHGPREIADVLHSWTRALGASMSEAGGGRDDLVALWRSMTAERRVIVVIDNARPDHVEDLIPASPESVILVTSRDRMITGGGIVHRLPVPPLPNHDAVEVLSLYSRMPGHIVAPLAERCAGLPLALRVAGEDAGAHWGPEEITEMAHDFDALPQQTAIDRATALSYQRLSAETARAWRLLAHVGDPTLGAAAAAMNTTTTQARTWLHEALRANLLDRSGSAWVYHDLHRSFAVRASRDQDDPELIHDIVRRALLWFLHGLASADEWFANRDDQPDLIALPAGIEIPEFGSYEDAWSWVESRWSSLVPAVNIAVTYGESTLAWQLVAINFHWAFLAKPWSSWEKTARTAMDAARAAEDYLGQAWLHHVISCIRGDGGDYDGAALHEHTALELRRWLGEIRDTGWSAINLVRWKVGRGDADAEIEPLIREGIEAHRAIGMRAGVCLGLAARGRLASRRGEFGAAREHLQDAVAELDNLGDPAIYAYVQTRLAEVLIRQGEFGAGRTHAKLADDAAAEAGADYFRISALSAQALTYSTTDRDTLWHVLHLAVTLADKLGDPREADLRERLDALS